MVTFGSECQPEKEVSEEIVPLTTTEVIQQRLGDFTRIFEETEDGDEHVD